MNLIFSADDNWGIGRDNNLLFYAKGDMKRFREMTTGNVVIMGRKTLESLPKSRPLPNRENIVLTTDTGFAVQDAAVCNSVGDLLAHIKAYDSRRLFVIGGEQIYKALLPYCDTAYITRFFAKSEADRFMPDFDALDDWRKSEMSEIFEENGLSYQFITYTRIR